MKQLFLKISTFLFLSLYAPISVLAFSFFQNLDDQTNDLIKPVEPDKTFIEIAVQVLDTLLLVAAITALLANLWSGIKYITAGGDSAKAETAKKWLIYTIIALIIIAFSYLILYTAKQLINEANSGLDVKLWIF